MRNVSRNRNSNGRWPSDPGLDRPHAASTVSVRLTTVPPTLTMVDTHTARLISPPEKMVTYADGSNSRGRNTMPPVALMVWREARLVTSTDHRGTSTDRASNARTTALTPTPSGEGFSSHTGR